MRHRIEPDSLPATAPVRTRPHLLSRARTGDPARLRGVVQALEAIAAGDLTRSIGSTSSDDLGAVEQAVDALVAGLLPVIATVQQGTTILHEDRMVIAGTNKEMLEAAEMTAGQAYDVGVAADAVSDSIGIVAASTEELAATVNDIARHATLAADVAVTAASQGELAERGMAELTSAVNRVEGLATVIATIAGQTRLLALNATIEAARAGEAGLGFAVVADEVKALSRATAEATEQVHAILAEMQEVSTSASTAIQEISSTMGRIVESTASIASAVVQQTATTREIGQVSEAAARNAVDISGRVATVHLRAREVAYLGANNGSTKSQSLEQLEDALRAVAEGFDVGGYVADMRVEDDEIVDQEALNLAGTTTVDGVTSILDMVMGTGLDQLDYTGSWLHGSGYPGEPSGDAYSCLPGDRVTLRFVGTRLRFWGYADQQQGMAELSVDGQPGTAVDFYSPVRGRTALWESPQLPYGEHVFSLEVLPSKHPQSRYFWVSVAMIDIFR